MAEYGGECKVLGVAPPLVCPGWRLGVVQVAPAQPDLVRLCRVTGAARGWAVCAM